jgi:hypothetical protein
LPAQDGSRNLQIFDRQTDVFVSRHVAEDKTRALSGTFAAPFLAVEDPGGCHADEGTVDQFDGDNTPIDVQVAILTQHIRLDDVGCRGGPGT